VQSAVEQVRINFCEQSLNVPWYAENVACGAELRAVLFKHRHESINLQLLAKIEAFF